MSTLTIFTVCVTSFKEEIKGKHASRYKGAGEGYQSINQSIDGQKYKPH